ncbi:MAG: hypothetical protein WB984_05565 [Thermoplasmata archaeon]
MERNRPRRRSDPRVDVSLAFERIRGDRSHGARALADEALRALAELLEGWAHLPEARLRSRVRQVARALEEAQPAMGPFLRWAEDLRRLARTTPSDDLARSARSWTRRERSRLAAEMPRLIRTSRRRFPRGARHVVTLSRSQTVLLALSALSRARRPSRVSVLESLPGGEGRLFARDLRRVGLSAGVVPDRKGPEVVATADLVILGADAVFSDGSVVHKVGTRSLARAAERSGVPVVVVAGRSKFTGRPVPRRPLPEWFDRTPSRYISEFWTDTGARVGGARRRLGRHRRPL